MARCKVACFLPPPERDLPGPVGAAVYAGFVRELLEASEQVELAPPADAAVVLSLDGRFRAAPGRTTVTAIYDLGHLIERRAYGPLAWLRQNWAVASAARRSHHLLAPSPAVAYGLQHYLRVPADHVSILEPLPRPEFRRSDRHRAQELAHALGLPARYFLFVGRRSRRKNLALLDRAWALAAPHLGSDVGLVLAGPGSGTLAAGRDLGYVDQHRLPDLLSGALAWLAPSFYEGCAVGALEAMACGVPPLVAGTGALARAVDAAGLILDPDDPGQWAEAMTAVAGRDALRSSLSAAGRKAIAERRSHPPDPTALLGAISWQRSSSERPEPSGPAR